MKKAEMDAAVIIPKPAKMEKMGGVFSLQSSTSIQFVQGDEDVLAIASTLQSLLLEETGLSLPIEPYSCRTPARGSILFVKDGGSSGLGEEGYALMVTQGSALIRGEKHQGLLHGVQTFRQLIAIESTKESVEKGTAFAIPCVQIEDKPSFSWRGMLLDPCRHFLEKEKILKMIDLMALYKLNVLHLHLSDDEGWRVEINKYPQLTERGAWRDLGDGIRYGGFYTQEDIREIVRFAQSRGIMVVPEIDCPGHSGAVLATFPELHCTGLLKAVPSPWLRDESLDGRTFCAGEEKVFSFLKDMWSEILELFPAPFVHLGGDEALKNFWEQCPKCRRRMKEEGLANTSELQIYFIRRIAQFLRSKGRRVIGWDEIQEGKPAPDDVVQAYRGKAGGLAAARKGNDVIMSPAGKDESPDPPPYADKNVYFNHSLSEVNLRDAYHFTPLPQGLPSHLQHHILGSECCLWSEFIPQESLEDHTFPRFFTFAERLWSGEGPDDFGAFFSRVQIHADILSARGVKTGPAFATSPEPVIPAKVKVDMVRPYDFPEGSRYNLECFQPLSAFDGNMDTLCLTVGPQKGECFEIRLEEPQLFQRLEVYTGLRDGNYILLHGVLEVHYEGDDSFQEVATFSKGNAAASLDPRPVRAVRLRAVKGQNVHNWLAVREIILEREGKSTVRHVTPIERLGEV